jgi:hypothetical protein
MGVGRHGWRWAALGLVVLVASGLLSACTSFHGPLTYLDAVDQYAVTRWAASAATNMVGINNGIYLLPQDHLILVHIYVPPSVTSLGPGAVHGAVGVWWVALDDRLPGDSTPVWQAGCVRFKTGAKGAEFDVVGSYLDGPAPRSLNRYPLVINPEDSSISVALSPADEITVPRDGGRPTGQAAPLAPTGICTTG